MVDQQKTPLFRPMAIMLICIGILFGGIFSYKYFGSFMMKRAMSEQALPPVAISATQIILQSWKSEVTAVGSLRAIRGVDVTSDITGLIRRLHICSGMEVKEGDPLFDLTDAVEIARLESLKADAELAEVNYKRDMAQYAVRAVSKAVVDTDEATLKSKKALVAEQEAILAKKTIRAPFSGKLGILTVDLGWYIKPGDSLIPLQALDPIYVNFTLPQQALPNLKVGDVITFKTDTYPQLLFKGKINALNSKVDPTTRNIEAQGMLINPDHQLLPGMYGIVTLTVAAPADYLTLPQAAVSYNPYGDYVYVLKEKEKDKDGKTLFTANQKFITTGEKRGDQVQILKGLGKGELIVTSGQLKLKNGSVVFINNDIMPNNVKNPVFKAR